MQGLLAKLRTARSQSDETRDGDRTHGEDITSNQTQVNNEINNQLNKTRCKSDSAVNGGLSNGHVIKIPVPSLNLNDSAVNEDIDAFSTLSSYRTEDALAIDIVMATNAGTKVTGKKMRASSPKHGARGARGIRGSRVSLNSTSERDDMSIMGDSDDEGTARHGNNGLNGTSQAWAAFEDEVKNIDNTNTELFTKKPKPNFESSGTFQKVMMDMYGNTEYGNTKGYTLLKLKLNNMAKATALASRMMTSAVNRGQMERERLEREREAREQAEAEEEIANGPDSSAQAFAGKRGWKILKRNVQDTAMEHKCQSTKLNWTMLQHTVKQMTNTDRTRQDLYERYGILPTRLDDGTIICENRMLSEKARAQLHSESNDKTDGLSHAIRRPRSYQPPPAHLRSRSQIGFQKHPRDGLKSANMNGKTFRPKTAK